MAANKNHVNSLGRAVPLSNTRQIGFKFHATDDTKTEVTTAGYFNNVRADLSVGTIIAVVADLDGTPKFMFLRCTAVPASGNVTVAVIASETS